MPLGQRVQPVGSSFVSVNDTTGQEDVDWATKASDTVVTYVGQVRDKTTGPALVASRYAVYALALALIAFVLLILMIVALVRLLVTATGYLAFVEPGETWLAYYILGGIFLLAGMILWRKKERV